MIFGFNTDVKRGDTVYHVQSEARQQDLLLQTQVFVKGRCLGKRAWSYAARVLDPSFTEQQMHEMLKAQHRTLLEAVREGRAEATFVGAFLIEDAGGQGLALEWLNPEVAWESGPMGLRFRVSDLGAPALGAQVGIRAEISAESPILTQGTTGEDGATEVTISVGEDTGKTELALLVEAGHGGKSATRKFRVRRAVGASSSSS